MIPDPRVMACMFPTPPEPGTIIEYPFRSGKPFRVLDDGTLEPVTIPKRYRPKNTHRYPAKKGRRKASA